ncbi:hypothetical protein CC80DRAFT_529496 [Byssothecium circinans]|uniref:N-acetyltransferase domain-containing protein n=1 Tax=Byssothecium circinans TaxID=147558 RepID=A0A6A5TBY1_9PLEO|nr:hypothetical protein CC80DRAFT_529496 [Byssothecium circinans]
MTAPFIRHYNSQDWANGLHKAYVSLSPETCFVLDSGSGTAVGYIIGTADTVAFAQRWMDTFTPVVDPKLVPRPGLDTGVALMEHAEAKDLRRAIYSGECSMLQAQPHLLRRKGWGPKMVTTFLDRVKALGAGGVHLGMVETNDRAKEFYERHGFQFGKGGQQGGAICLVKDI